MCLDVSCSFIKWSCLLFLEPFHLWVLQLRKLFLGISWDCLEGKGGKSLMISLFISTFYISCLPFSWALILTNFAHLCLFLVSSFYPYNRIISLDLRFLTVAFFSQNCWDIISLSSANLTLFKRLTYFFNILYAYKIIENTEIQKFHSDTCIC